MPRLKLFAEHIAEWQRKTDAAMCNERGNYFSGFDNEFMDGKMDGAYMCAELILKQNNEQ